MLAASVIIPTYHRPDDLRNCIASVLEQTALPRELIIVDDGALEAVPLHEEVEAKGVRLIYHRKDKPGLTASRNVGVSLAGGDVIFFLDDDVVLLPDYLQRMLEVFETDKDEEIAGVGGRILNTKPLTWKLKLRWLFDLAFLNADWREGRVLPSGFCSDLGTTPFPIRKPTDVDFLPGGVSAYRRQVFDHVTFSEVYKGYGLGEDKDFTFRLSRRWRLVATPAAGLYHYHSSCMRLDKHSLGRDYVLGRYRFFRDHLDRGMLSRLALGWAVLGYAVLRTVIWAASRDAGEGRRVRGILGAVSDIMLRRLKD